MRSVVIGIVLVLGVACGGASRSRRQAPRPAAAPSLLAHVPADTPYVLASLDGGDSPVMRRLYDRSVAPLLQLTTLSADDRRALTPGMRALMVVLDELRGQPADAWWSALGLARELRFVLYGYAPYPVFRVEIADPQRLRGIIERAIAAAGVSVAPPAPGQPPHWSIPVDRARFVIAIDERDRQLVVAALPADAVAGALPHLLGTARPARSLATSPRIPELLARYQLAQQTFLELDVRRAVGMVTRPASPLEARLAASVPPLTPACRADLDRLAAAVPRFILGYRRIAEDGFDGSMIFEVPPSVTRALAGARAGVPALPASRSQPLFALAIALDVDAALRWVAEVAAAWQARPPVDGARCAWFDDLDQIAGEAAAGIGAYLATQPGSGVAGKLALAHGLRGVALVVDDFAFSPPRLDAELTLIGDHVRDVLRALGVTAPVFTDGVALPISFAQLGPWVRNAHAATRGDRLVVAVGADSERRVVDRVRAPVPRRSPLVAAEADLRRLEALLETAGRTSRKAYIGTMNMTLELREDAIELRTSGSW